MSELITNLNEAVSSGRESLLSDSTITNDNNSETQTSSSLGSALEEFETEILHSPLPVAIKQRINELRETKGSEIFSQNSELTTLIREMQSPPISNWVEKGVLTLPLIFAGQERHLISRIEEALAEYLKTPNGSKDNEIKRLREFIDGHTDVQVDLINVARSMGLKINSAKLLIPGQKEKLRATMLRLAEQRLNELVPIKVGWDDKPGDWQSGRQNDKAAAGTISTELVSASRAKLSEVTQVLSRDRQVVENSSKAVGNLDFLRDNIDLLTRLIQSISEDLLGRVSEHTELLSLIARGSINIDELVKDMRAQETLSTINLRHTFSKIVKSYWDASRYSLAEPSLLGLSISENDLTAVRQNLELIDKLAELCGVKAYLGAEHTSQQIRADVVDAQKLFFENMESDASLYWHFDARGLDIVESGELQSGAMVGREHRNTGEWSTGIHFTKPGAGMHSHDNYPGYATATRSFGSKKSLVRPFGVALIYKLGDIVKYTPKRTEPKIDANRGRANISEDVVFRPDSGQDSYSYDLKDAYVVPMATKEQLDIIKEDPRFEDLFKQPIKSNLLARQVLERALGISGYTEEWISNHVIPYWEGVDSTAEDISNPYHNRQKGELELQASVSHKIQAAQTPNSRLILAISAKKGALEAVGHIYGAAPQVWTEDLIELQVKS